MNASFRNKSGFTMLEVIIALAILGIVTVLAYSFFTYGMNIVKTGERQSDLQAEIRRAADFISSETRFSDCVELLDSAKVSSLVSGATPFSNQKKYIYVDSGGAVLFRIASAPPRKIAETSGNMDLKFDKTDTDKILTFAITGQNNGRTYDINSETIIQNIGKNSITGTPSAGGMGICFGPLSDKEVVTADTSILSIAGDLNAVVGDLLLSTAGPVGSTITWSSSDNSIIRSTDGKVTRPVAGEYTVVTLTATIVKGSENTTRTFSVKVLGYPLTGVKVNVLAGMLENTTTSMDYKIGTGSWTTASAINTIVTYTSGEVWVRWPSVSGSDLKVATIAASLGAPGVLLSDVNDSKAWFKKTSGVRVVATDGYEYLLNSSSWIAIVDNTTINTNGNNNIIVRIKATNDTLPSTATDDLDTNT